MNHSLYLKAVRDVQLAVKQWFLWSYLAFIEIRLRYRRSLLGPWWITLSMGIFSTAMGFVYSRLFHQDVLSYMPFLISGMVIWSFISSVVIESCDIFKNAQGLIKQTQLPFFTYILKHLLKNVIILGHNFVVYVVLFFVCQLHLTASIFLLIPGFLLLLFNLLWVSLFLGMVGSRFRDIPPIITSFMQVAFFVSPITWMPELLGETSRILKWNPITYVMDVVRAPLVGQTPQLLSFLVLTILAIVGLLGSFVLFARYRSRIAYWVE